MNATLILDEDGSVVLPQELREALHLGAGDTLALESEGERIILRPVHAEGSPHAEGSMVQEHGVWVFHAGKTLTADAANDTLDRVREERGLPGPGGSS
jgi:AbrB family looped-hinge helix DNA binding protein